MRINKIFKNINAIFNLFKPISLVSADHNYKNVFLKEVKDIESITGRNISDLKVLIMGCGYLYTDVLLMKNVAKEVVGVDVLEIFFKDGYIKLFRNYLKNNKSIISSLFNSIKKRRGIKHYYNYLESISRFKIDYNNVNLISYSGTDIPIESKYFDVVISNAVLEHAMDLNTFFKEIHRVTKDSGLSYHLYHNYYSFSGGHLPEIYCYKNPWGHLRGIYKTSDAQLNRVTIEQVSRIFNKYFNRCTVYHVDKRHNKKDVDSNFSYEKEDLLTKEIKTELNSYSKDILLTRAFLISGLKSFRINL
tara:strand:- start:183 stop:1094 length:912 start_codon:yes stop_codon:yes gene_type:complete